MSVKKREIRARVTQQELADLAGVDRTVVNLGLNDRWKYGPGPGFERFERAVDLVIQEPVAEFDGPNKQRVLLRLARQLADPGAARKSAE